MKPSAFIIPAEVHTDDFVAQAQFDAFPWFAQASDSAIEELIGCGFRGDYAADDVAEYMRGIHPQVDRVFDYLQDRRAVESIGFEVSVDEDAAIAWLRINRPALVPVE